MVKSRLDYLIYTYNQGTCTDPERTELLAWYHLQGHVDAEYPDSEVAVFERLFSRMLDDTQYRKRRIQNRIRILTCASAAAVLLSFFIFLAYRYIGSSDLDDHAVATIEPGGYRAVLTLADGSQLKLDSAHQGIILADGSISYEGDNAALTSLPQDLHQALTLTTPNGGTYKITLSDGTDVWLNAGSTLRYPLQFSSDQRTVELEGEAFFHVNAASNKDTKRRIPFTVVSLGQKVQVLGTQFNISGYRSDGAPKTTLVEGSIAIQSKVFQPHSFAVTKKLRPGQQAVVSGNDIAIREVDVDTEIAWKEGRFRFEGKRFDHVFNELARWYDFEVEYVGGIPQEEFYGGAFRNDNIKVILNMLESAGLTYKMKGRKLQIINKERR